MFHEVLANLKMTHSHWLYIPSLHPVLIVTSKIHFSFCFPNHHLTPNHLDRQLQMHEREAESEPEVATELSHQAEGGVGNHLSGHWHRFAKYEDKSRLWDFGFWHKTGLDVHLCAGLVTGVISRIAILHVLINSIFTDVTSTDLCVWVPEVKTTSIPWNISSLPFSCIFNEPRCGAIELGHQLLVHVCKPAWRDEVSESHFYFAIFSRICKFKECFQKPAFILSTNDWGWAWRGRQRQSDKDTVVDLHHIKDKSKIKRT